MDIDEKTEIAETFIYGLVYRDWRALRLIMVDDVVWSLPGTSAISGVVSGVDAVISRAEAIINRGISFGLKHILVGDQGVALSLHNTASRGDLLFDEHLATVCQIRDGKIYAINTYLSDVGMLNRFFD